MLIRSFSKSVRPKELRPPAWDVTLIPQSLTRAPYEPLQTSDERFLAQKTLSLLALARLSGLVNFTPFHIVSLTPGTGARFPSPSLQVLWQRRRIPPPLLLSFRDLLYRPYQMRAQIAMGDLCPVRAVRCYLDRTAAHHLRCERLFVTAGRSMKEIARNTVSFWLRKTISRVYQLSGRSVLDPPPRA